MEEQTITFAELRDGDTLVDKSGNRWLVLDILDHRGAYNADFWLADPVTKIKMHNINKPKRDTCTVLRTPTHADEWAQRLLEMPVAVGNHIRPTNESDVTTLSYIVPISDQSAELLSSPDITEKLAAAMAKPFDSTDDAGQAEVVEQLGAVTIAEVTVAETDAANAATVDAPIELPAFSSLNDLEMRSHLYLLHGVYGDDIQPRAYLVALHDRAHQAHADGFLNARFRPHVHAEATA